MSASASAAHPPVEQLSAYLDDVLGASEREHVAAHVEGCFACRHRLDGLRRTIARLAAIEREAPPAPLGALVARRVALAGERQGLAGLLRRRVLDRPQSPLLSTFAVVIALAAAAYLLAQGAGRERHGYGTVTLVPAPAVSSAGPEGEMAPAEIALAGRRFVLRDGIWWQRDLAIDTVRSWSAPDAALRARHPELEELLARDGVWRLEVDGRPIEVRAGTATDVNTARSPAP